MNVVLRRVWHVEVDHVRNVGHINTASCNIGRHEGFQLTTLEFVQRLLALCLRHVTMDRLSRHTIGIQAGCKTGAALLGQSKHRCALALVLLQQLFEQRELGIFLQMRNLLRHSLNRGRRRSGAHLNWVGQKAF